MINNTHRTDEAIRRIDVAALIHLVVCMLIALGVTAQDKPTTRTVTPTPVDEVYRIVIVKDVGDKEGRDNRLMLETLGYIPVHMTGDFGSGKGTVLLGNFPTQEEAQKIKEQLVRDGFMPLDIVKVRRPQNVAAAFTVLVDWFDEESAAQDVRKKLIALGMLQVNASQDIQTGKYFVTVGHFINTDHANPIVNQLKELHGWKDAYIVDASNLRHVLPLEEAFTASSLTTAEIRAKTGNRFSEEELKEIERLVNLKLMQEEKQKAGGGRDSAVEDEIDRINEKMIAMDRVGCGVGLDNSHMREEDLQAANRRKRIAELYRESNDLAKSGKTEDALVKIRAILAMDQANAMALQRERVLQNMHGCSELDSFDIERKYEILKQQAVESAKSGAIPDLIVAKTTWAQIMVLHDRYKPEAEARIKSLTKRIEKLEEKHSRKQKWGFFGY